MRTKRYLAPDWWRGRVASRRVSTLRHRRPIASVVYGMAPPGQRRCRLSYHDRLGIRGKRVQRGSNADAHRPQPSISLAKLLNFSRSIVRCAPQRRIATLHQIHTLSHCGGTQSRSAVSPRVLVNESHCSSDDPNSLPPPTVELPVMLNGA